MNNNRGQNSNNQPQNNYPQQGYLQQNNQYRQNGYNEQTQQDYSGNFSNQPGYQNQHQIPSQYQKNENFDRNHQFNNQQYQGYSNQQNSAYGGNGYVGQNQQYTNQQNNYYRGPGYTQQNLNGNANFQQGYQNYQQTNPQFNNVNNQQQFNNQNRYNNPNQFNPQLGQNNPNFHPMYGKKKIDNKTIGIIAAIVAVLVVVFIAFGSSGRAGGSTPKDAVEGWMNTIKKGDFNKMMDYIHFESPESKQAALEELKEVERTEKYKLDMAKSIVELAEVSDVKMIDDNTAKVMLKTKGLDLAKLFDSDSQRTIKVKKYNGRWYLTENPF